VSRRGEIARKMREGLSGVVVKGQVRGARVGKDGGGTPKYKEMWKGYRKWKCI
jgi:hypothetical protein